MKNAPFSCLVDTDFPGGNAVIESVGDDTIRLRPDLRDTVTNWFYWAVRVRGAGGRTLHFEFSAQHSLADRGPALSLDGGKTWRWLGRTEGSRGGFVVTLPTDADDMLLSMGMIYTRANWDRFMAGLADPSRVRVESLCRTRKNRDVPLIRVGKVDGKARYRVLLTARAHSCEMMQNYVMEGFVAAATGIDELGQWYSQNVELAAVPFMDTDGVEDGDQGKARAPRDHNRDFRPPHVHVETAALIGFAEKWFDGRPAVTIDMHCPWIHGPTEEIVFQVGNADPTVWHRQQELAAALERLRVGPIPYLASNDLPFGKTWNTGTGEYLCLSRWAGGKRGVVLATTFETPYATASGVEVNAESARALGRDMAAAVRAFLEASGKN